MQSNSSSVEAYLSELPADRREAVEAVREVVVENLPDGYEETVNWGMITYQVPLETYPDTYNGEPLMYAALASQKNHISLYLIAMYMDEEAQEEFERKYRATGKPYDMGKSCVRFRKPDDLPLSLIAEAVASLDVGEFIGQFEEARARRKRTRS